MDRLQMQHEDREFDARRALSLVGVDFDSTEIDPGTHLPVSATTVAERLVRNARSGSLSLGSEAVSRLVAVLEADNV